MKKLILITVIFFVASCVFAADHDLYLLFGSGQEVGHLGIGLQYDINRFGIGAAVGITTYPYVGTTMTWEAFSKYYFADWGPKSQDRFYFAVGYGIVGTYQTYTDFQVEDEGRLQGPWFEIGLRYFLSKGNFGGNLALGITYPINSPGYSNKSFAFIYTAAFGYLINL